MSHSSPMFEAVFFFDQARITRELLYTEFEAILDGFIPVPECADAQVNAAYAQVGPTLTLAGVVFFQISFDDKGMVDRRWNLPLQQLLGVAAPGPDLGDGPIRLACYSQCPIAWHQQSLWDPSMQPESNSFVALHQAVRANRLGFIAAPKASKTGSSREAIAPLGEDAFIKERAALEQKLHDYYTAELNKQVGQLVNEQQLQLATLRRDKEAALQGLQQEHQERLAAYQQELQRLAQENKELHERNHSLKETLDVQASKVEGMREYFVHKLNAAQQVESSQIQLLQDNFALELDAKIRAATAELREMLDMREVELFYRHQNESALKEEIVQLKQDNQQLLKNSGDQLLSRLVKAGVNLVSYLPGLGEVAIPLEDIGVFLEDPQHYAAQKVGVSEALYLAWLAHHQSPCCNAVNARGETCGEPVRLLESPLEFHPGESDRCTQHQSIILSRVADGR